MHSCNSFLNRCKGVNTAKKTRLKWIEADIGRCRIITHHSKPVFSDSFCSAVANISAKILPGSLSLSSLNPYFISFVFFWLLQISEEKISLMHANRCKKYSTRFQNFILSSTTFSSALFFDFLFLQLYSRTGLVMRSHCLCSQSFYSLHFRSYSLFQYILIFIRNGFFRCAAAFNASTNRVYSVCAC